jgi:hypothetical protein
MGLFVVDSEKARCNIEEAKLSGPFDNLGKHQRVNGVQIVMLIPTVGYTRLPRATSCRTFLSSALLPEALSRNLSTYLSDVL